MFCLCTQNCLRIQFLRLAQKSKINVDFSWAPTYAILISLKVQRIRPLGHRFSNFKKTLIAYARKNSPQIIEIIGIFEKKHRTYFLWRFFLYLRRFLLMLGDLMFRAIFLVLRKIILWVCIVLITSRVDLAMSVCQYERLLWGEISYDL